MAIRKLGGLAVSLAATAAMFAAGTGAAQAEKPPPPGY